jgi:hypothetical protein
MKKKSFTAEVQSGHKEAAIEVPFDPAQVWGLPPKPLWHGRRGYVVSGSLTGSHFEESFIVPRSQRFFMLIDAELQQAAGVSVGDIVDVAVAPINAESRT